MTRRLHYLAILAALLLAAQTHPVRSQDAAQKDSTRVVQLVLDPKPEPEPTLAYRLETPYMEQRPGNGAPLYTTAIALATQIQAKNPDLTEETLGEWIKGTVDKWPAQEVRKAVARFDQAIHCLDLAGRSDHCTWEFPLREEGLRCATPNWGDFRILSWVLALKARLQMMDGKTDDAIDTLRTALTMTRDIGNGPLTIQNMVGIGLAARVIREIEGFIQQPAMPNLYWALTALPHPLIDMRQSIQMESDAVYVEVPELRRLDSRVLSNDEVMALWNKMAASVSADAEGIEQAAVKLAMTTSAIKLYPIAKQRLLEQGRTPQEVESLPHLYVVLAYQHERARCMRDMQLKWADVPYWQAANGLAVSEKRWQEHVGRVRKDMDVIGMAFEHSQPYFRWLHFTNTRMERDLAMLRCVEAIRIYAAAHDSRLPKSLNDITEVPLPLDPFYGRPFGYRITGDKAILESPAPPQEDSFHGTRYEITLKRTTR